MKGKSLKEKALLLISRILVGVLFIFSGLIKANDPLGFSYKLQEYFEVFHISFINDYATGLAIFLCALEMILGAALLLGIRSVLVTRGLLLLIVFFTFLTFYSAAFNVVRTCGCFGDAIPLSPWQSFEKDLILLLLIIFLYTGRTEIHSVFRTEKLERVSLWIISILSLGAGLWTYNFLPVIDFLPYKKGANIPGEMKIPPGAPVDQYEITYHLVNKKSHAEQSMSDKKYLSSGIWKDNNWEIKGDPLNRLIKKGFEPKIRDLKISDSKGTEYTSEIVEHPYYNLVIVAYNLGDANKKAIGDLNALAINAAENFNIRTVLLTSASADDTRAFIKKYHLVMQTFFADAVPLKTMVRANPGLLLLKKGTVIGKWHYHTIPSYDELSASYFAKSSP